MEICFIYTLKLGTGGRLSMSAHSPRLQFVIGLPDSSKTKVKGVVLVKGLWYETSRSSGLPFNLNHPYIPGVGSITVLVHFSLPWAVGVLTYLFS